MARVAISRGAEPERLVKDALSLLGLEARLKPSSSVLVKPNLVRVPRDSPYARDPGAYETCPWEGDIVHREIIAATLRALTEMGFRDVTIGEASGGAQTPVVYKALQLYELAEEYGVKIVDLNYEDSERVAVPGEGYMKSVWIPKILRRMDFLVSVAALKTWSLTLKNWGIGILPGKYYGWNRAVDSSHGGRLRGIDDPLPMHERGPRDYIDGQEVAVSRVIADVCATQRCDLGVVDGLAVLKPETRDGRVHYRTGHPNLVIAGDNLVAVDSVASRVLGLDPRKNLHIRFSAERGLGPIGLVDMDLRGVSIQDARGEVFKDTALRPP